MSKRRKLDSENSARQRNYLALSPNGNSICRRQLPLKILSEERSFGEIFIDGVYRSCTYLVASTIHFQESFSIFVYLPFLSMSSEGNSRDLFWGWRGGLRNELTVSAKEESPFEK